MSTPEGGALPGLVAVEAQHRLVGHLPQERELVLAERGPSGATVAAKPAVTMAITST